jgi:hypothetical protein
VASDDTNLPPLRVGLTQPQRQVLHFHISKIVAIKITPSLGKPYAKPLYDFLVEYRMAISPPQFN